MSSQNYNSQTSAIGSQSRANDDPGRPNFLARRMGAGGVLAVIAVGAVLGFKDITNNGGQTLPQKSPYTWAEANKIHKVPAVAHEGQSGTISAMIAKVDGDVKNNTELNQLEAVVEDEHPGYGANTVAGEHFKIPDLALATSPDKQ